MKGRDSSFLLTSVLRPRDSPVPLYLLIPLASAILYALASMAIKRALQENVKLNQVFHLSNFVLAILFLPLLFLEEKAFPAELLWKPIFMGCVFFVANWLTFLSLQKGDVSLVTPLLGTKVVFVAIAVVLLMKQPLSPALWIAAVFTASGIFATGFGDFSAGDRRQLVFTIGVTLASAAAFGVSDVLVSWWAGEFGELAFLSISCLSIGACSLITWLVQRCPSLRASTSVGNRWVWLGCVLIAVQALGMGISLSFFADDATGINVVYASRGLWAIIFVVVLGNSWLRVQEHREQGRAFIWRIVGTLVLSVAIVIAVIDRSGAF